MVDRKGDLASFARRIVFTEIGGKIRPGSFKRFMDVSFILFEKIAYRFECLSQKYIELYEEIVNNEIQLGNISSKDDVIVIGSGSIPSTPILLFEKSKASIVGLDIDHKAVNRSKDFLKRRKLEKNIKIRNEDGLSFSIKDFDVIFILFGVTKQIQILKRLSKEMNNNTRIIYRCPTDTDDRIDKERINLDSKFKVQGNITSNSLGKVDSYLLMKK